MKERITAFLRAENKTSVQFAEEIGVQPSSISHILSGRNNPSLDFVLKMLGKYKYLSMDWLLFGTGKMYKEGNESILADYSDNKDKETIDKGIFKQPDLFSVNFGEQIDSGSTIVDTKPKEQNISLTEKQNVGNKEDGSKIEKIVWFFNDNTFRVFEIK